LPDSPGDSTKIQGVSVHLAVTPSSINFTDNSPKHHCNSMQKAISLLLSLLK